MTDTPELMTPGQRNYIESMLAGKEIPSDAHVWYLDHEAFLTKARASEVIDRLKKYPWKTRSESAPAVQLRPGVHYDLTHEPVIGFVVVDGVKIPRGSYAVLTPDATNQTSFFRLWIGDYQDPRFHERMSMDQLFGPEREKVNPTRRAKILGMIAEQGPAECAMRYGLEIGKCGICGRRLTNDISRERGIGPVCAERWGW